MDNLTHSLIGAAIGEAAHQVAPNPTPKRRAWFIWVSVLGNNFPDWDFLYTWITPGTVGYLLHHRGHTHTLVGIVPQTIFCLALLALWSRFRGPLTRQQWQWTAGLLVFGMGVHVLADWMNFYGVHPFWPLDNQWYYGDSVFIIEPSLWAGLVGLGLTAVRSWGWRAALLFPCIAAPLLGIRLGYVLVPSFLWCLAILGVGYWAGKRITPKNRALLAVGGIGAFFLVSKLVSITARSTSSSLVQDAFPGWKVEELIVDPTPANPLCWSTLSLVSNDTEVRTEVGVISLLPRILPASRCPRRYRPGLGVPLGAGRIPNSASYHSFGNYRLAREEFDNLHGNDCEFRAFLRFSRVPYVDSSQFSDLRFALTAKENFTSIERKTDREGAACPPWIPNWTPPRQSLLRN